MRILSTATSSTRALWPNAGAPLSATRSIRMNATRRRSHLSTGMAAGGAAAGNGSTGSAMGGGATSDGRRPYFSIRYRIVLREMPRAAAAREMFQPVDWRAATRASRSTAPVDVAGTARGVEDAAGIAAPDAVGRAPADAAR